MVGSDRSCEIIYNGACPVCSAGVRAVRGDGAADCTDIIEDSEVLHEAGLTAEEVQYRLHARTLDGRIVRGVDAIAVLLSGSPRWRWAGRLAGQPGFRQVGWVAYEVTAFLLFRWNKWKGNF